MQRKSLLRFPAALLAALALTLTGCADSATAPDRFQDGQVSAAMTRVDVCHVDDGGAYRLITVADAAYETHIQHGDAAPGQPVPGQLGYVFADDCTAVAADGVFGNVEWTTVSGTYWSRIEVYAGADGTVQTTGGNANSSWSFSVTCLKITGDQAWFAGTRDGDGAPVVFYAVDAATDQFNQWTSQGGTTHDYTCANLGAWSSGKTVFDGDLTIR